MFELYSFVRLFIYSDIHLVLRT